MLVEIELSNKWHYSSDEPWACNDITCNALIYWSLRVLEQMRRASTPNTCHFDSSTVSSKQVQMILCLLYNTSRHGQLFFLLKQKFMLWIYLKKHCFISFIVRPNEATIDSIIMIHRYIYCDENYNIKR